MDARRAADSLKARPEKTDKADAQALAEMLASGWYSPVHVKTMESHRLKALLGAREQLINVKRQLYGQARGLLRPFGIKISARAAASGLTRRSVPPATGMMRSILVSRHSSTRLRGLRSNWPAWTRRCAR